VAHERKRWPAFLWRRLGPHPFDDSLGGWNPGISVPRRDGDLLLRVSDTELGPGDGFCLVYSPFDLVPGADLKWSPKYSYA